MLAHLNLICMSFLSVLMNIHTLCKADELNVSTVGLNCMLIHSVLMNIYISSWMTV